jgi:hypothetical protein
MSTSPSESKFDPARRRLCPDGACVGLLDENGRCKECGLSGGGRGAAPAVIPSPALPDQPDQDDDREEAIEAAEAGSAFDPRRRLCPDGTCVGVIGADGRCPVCGRAAEE